MTIDLTQDFEGKDVNLTGIPTSLFYQKNEKTKEAYAVVGTLYHSCFLSKDPFTSLQNETQNPLDSESNDTNEEG